MREQHIREKVELHQDKQKRFADKKQENSKTTPRDKVWVSLHPVSKGPLKKTSKFMPKQDGPYVIVTTRFPTILILHILMNQTKFLANIMCLP